jgi:hypothetical protein
MARTQNFITPENLGATNSRFCDTVPKSKHKIIVLGFMGTCPIAGVIWQAIHYIVGLQRLGHDVYYIEDSSRVPYDPRAYSVTEDTTYVANVLGRLADEFGFAEKWAFSPRYRTRDETLGPLSRAQVNQLYRDADAVLNICGTNELNEDLLLSKRLVYVESDPGVEQIKVDKCEEDTIDFLSHYCALFTFGENIGRPEFPVPLHGFTWLPTRQPVVLDFWKTGAPPAPDAAFTSVANLATGGQKDIEWRGETYFWSKLPEFERFRLAPEKAGEDFELAANFHEAELASRFHSARWRSVSPDAMSTAFHDYLAYVKQSKGEFTVAKDQYVRLNTGWFSDRSACYLAAGRPVITQQTGFTRLYGGREGLFSFESMDDIVNAVESINADYPHHSRAAEAIAREWFDSTKVISSMLSRIGLG